MFTGSFKDHCGKIQREEKRGKKRNKEEKMKLETEKEDKEGKR